MQCNPAENRNITKRKLSRCGNRREAREKNVKLPLADCCPGRKSSWIWGLCCGEDTCEEPNKTSESERHPRQTNSLLAYFWHADIITRFTIWTQQLNNTMRSIYIGGIRVKLHVRMKRSDVKIHLALIQRLAHSHKNQNKFSRQKCHFFNFNGSHTPCTFF